jgi:glycine/D-amino acid oxidase-like deaminating enzyme/nitrite reductase/ring-hydroxylating ferredoxin subunit
VSAPDRRSWWERDLADGGSDSVAGTTALVEGERLSADAVVVGGGISGLMVAERLSAAGRSVVVVEAGRVGSGTTGSSTAKVTALHGATYHQLARVRGAEVAAVYAEANQLAVEDYQRLVDEHGLDCTWSRDDAYTYTTEESSLATIRAEADAAAAAGLPAEFVEQTSLPASVGVVGAVRCGAQAQFDPLRFVHGLAGVLVRRGVRIVEGARVASVEEGPPHAVLAAGARIEAPVVVLATLLPVHDPGLLFARITPVRSYALAATLRSPVPTGMHLSVDSPSRSVRGVAPGSPTGIFGGGGHRVGEDGDAVEQERLLEAWVRDHFEVESIDARWSAHDLVAVDHVPFIGREPMTADGIHVVSGSKKWGFTTAGVAARLITGLVVDGGHAWHAAFDPGRAPLQAQSAKEFVKGNAEVAGHFLGDRLRRRGELDDLGPGEGGIVRLDGARVAASRDDAGALHVVTSNCPHMGCVVDWNPVERSWDCPCHGSRFDPDGDVIVGPAVTGLRPVELRGE